MWSCGVTENDAHKRRSSLRRRGGGFECQRGGEARDSSRECCDACVCAVAAFLNVGGGGKQGTTLARTLKLTEAPLFDGGCSESEPAANGACANSARARRCRGVVGQCGGGSGSAMSRAPKRGARAGMGVNVGGGGDGCSKQAACRVPATFVGRGRGTADGSSLAALWDGLHSRCGRQQRRQRHFSRRERGHGVECVGVRAKAGVYGGDGSDGHWALRDIQAEFTNLARAV